ncbi:hypothetical protein Dsin_022051 [Dipteronia sinensis]|uniref:CCHC-type domain-containing protein n=1 Tax=Dipteronia sinensis TaxID=43782 RepID=A0AAE0A293_9ROSI|nr:hypothetical protein Dsin_022051 [Dipteronia sinensis]
MPIWVQLSTLPMEWMNSDLLWSIGGMLGRMYRVDPNTMNQARCRFARICVEIDISKPLLGSLSIDDRIIRVEYESLGIICFKCGKYDHNKESCRECMVDDIADEMVGTNEPLEGSEKKKKESPYGPWLLVSYWKPNNRNIRGRNGRVNTVNNSSSKRNDFNGKPGVNNSEPIGKTIDSHNDKLGNSKNAKNGTLREKNIAQSKSVAPGNGSSYRFDIINKDVDVMLAEEESQVLNKDSIGHDRKEKSVLTEITNQGKKLNREPSLSSKKIAKKIINQQTSHKGSKSASKRTGNGKGIKYSQYQVQKVVVPPTDNEELDSASVLCQVHNEVTNFVTNFSGS